MTTPEDAAFDADVARSLEALGANGSDPVLDALTDLRGAAEGLDAWSGSTTAERPAHADRVVLRVAHEHEAHEPAYGPDPVDPAWARIGRGSCEMTLAALALPAGGKASRERAEHVEIELTPAACCGAPVCHQDKSRASAWICLQGGRDQGRSRLLVAQAVGVSAAKAREKLEHVAARLAKGMGLPLLVQGQTLPAEGVSVPALSLCGEQGSPPLAAASIARFVLRAEADRVVLRDHASRGPRQTAWRIAGSGLALLAMAAGLWVWTAVAALERRAAVGLGIGASAMMFSVAAVAFLGVARFAARYNAHSNPLVWIGADRVVVAPWVNRRGAIDLRPEGRLGAAIRLGEVGAVSVATRDGQLVVELDTEHGRIDVVSVDREDIAALWCSALRRAIDEARHVAKEPHAG